MSIVKLEVKFVVYFCKKNILYQLGRGYSLISSIRGIYL